MENTQIRSKEQAIAALVLIYQMRPQDTIEYLMQIAENFSKDEHSIEERDCGGCGVPVAI